jgi:hypothetical protein
VNRDLSEVQDVGDADSIPMHEAAVILLEEVDYTLCGFET